MTTKTSKCFEKLRPGDILLLKNNIAIVFIANVDNMILTGSNSFEAQGWAVAHNSLECVRYPMLSNYKLGWWYSHYEFSQVVKRIKSA